MEPYRVYAVTLEAADGHIYGRPVYAPNRAAAIASAREITREEFPVPAADLLIATYCSESSGGGIALD